MEDVEKDRGRRFTFAGRAILLKCQLYILRLLTRHTQSDAKSKAQATPAEEIARC